MSWTPTSQDNQTKEFESRKADHIRLSLAAENEALGGSGFDRIELIHEALPEINFENIRISTSALGHEVPVPYFVSSMTAGHEQGFELNRRLAVACQGRGWWMGVGSQRRQLFDKEARREWADLRKLVPGVKLLGNLGLSQVIGTDLDLIEDLIGSLGAVGMIVHTNPLQEVLQPEGTPNFSGGYDALTRLAGRLKVPVILKETGCGFSKPTLLRLKSTGISAVDVSGFGGTHWGRIEGARAAKTDIRQPAAEAFAHWGISTVDSLVNAANVAPAYEVWASGGIRNGVEALKSLLLGGRMVGFAKPALEAALAGEAALDQWMRTREYELKAAMFCTGLSSLDNLNEKQVWRWLKA